MTDDYIPTRDEATRDEHNPGSWLNAPDRIAPAQLSMPDPCSHVTRIDAIRARLHGDAETLAHLDTCEETNA